VDDAVLIVPLKMIKIKVEKISVTWVFCNSVNQSPGLLHVGKGVLLIDMETMPKATINSPHQNFSEKGCKELVSV
jgi:hypothetical protein